MLKSKSLNILLRNLLDKADDLLAALIVDLDGLIIAQQSVAGFDEEVIGAIMSVLEQTMSKIRSFVETSFGSGTFDTNEFRLFYLELGGKIPALFVLVSDPYSNIEQFISYSYIAAEKISLILHDRDTPLELPKIDVNGNYIIESEKTSIDSKTIVSKIVIIGPKETGKSSFLDMYINGNFEANYKPTIGISFVEKEFQITSKIKLKFFLIGMAGLKTFAKVRRFYYRASKAVLLVFDYSRIETLESINEWIEKAKHFIDDAKIPYILIGNKIDLVEDREEIKSKAKKFATQCNCAFFEMSAYTGEGIDEVFTCLVSSTM